MSVSTGPEHPKIAGVIPKSKHPQTAQASALTICTRDFRGKAGGNSQRRGIARAQRSGLNRAIKTVSLERGTQTICTCAVSGDGLQAIDRADINLALFDPVTHALQRIGATA